MNIQYQLNREDFLQHQLYGASMKKSIKKKRWKSWLMSTFIFVVLSGVFYHYEVFMMAYYFAAFAIITLIFYPFYQKRLYRKHYEKYIDENFKNSFGHSVEVRFNDSDLLASDYTGESKINYSSFEKIIEISSHFFLKLMNGSMVIIPKSEMENEEEVRDTLRSLSKKVTIPYSLELDWKWK